MKIFSLLLTFFIFISCGNTKEVLSAKEDDKVVIKNEELEYEIIIIEPGFNSWLATQPTQDFFSQETLEIRNNRWVVEWNSRVLQPQRFNPNLYEMQIDYQPQIDYGKEVNYKLFMYFRYFQQKYQQRLSSQPFVN
ncbi:DUF6146 family protein [Pseudofulvibacter geojedonensis]|uniref:DUF6146 family protein n=1 Tax=Pseudofulvibacter geojedonensis TaxID=1123758 RepID=A0ABW3HYT5_9FLAO